MQADRYDTSHACLCAFVGTMCRHLHVLQHVMNKVLSLAANNTHSCTQCSNQHRTIAAVYLDVGFAVGATPPSVGVDVLIDSLDWRGKYTISTSLIIGAQCMLSVFDKLTLVHATVHRQVAGAVVDAA